MLISCFLHVFGGTTKSDKSSVFPGIDLSLAINTFLRKLLYSYEISLDSLKTVQVEKKDRREAFGCLKGKIHVPDDFNEPLDDFKEYT